MKKKKTKKKRVLPCIFDKRFIFAPHLAKVVKNTLFASKIRDVAQLV